MIDPHQVPAYSLPNPREIPPGMGAVANRHAAFRLL